LRQPVNVVPAHTGCTGPALVHLFSVLLHSCWTTQFRPLTVMVSPALPSAQMSAISPHVLLAQPAGNE
jgi:hypothetical protein